MSCLEGVFSETRLQVIERLCIGAPKNAAFLPYIHTRFALHIVGVNVYAGRQWVRPGSDP
jgi:hypothetical protein